MQWIIRPGDFKDMPGLLALAKSFPLSSLPADEKPLEKIVQASRLSFAKKLPPKRRRFLFVLASGDGNVIGSSQILSYQEHYYPCFICEGGGGVLRLILNQKGRTQLGGLVVDPLFRGAAEKFGRQIGLFRLLFIHAAGAGFTDTIEVSLTPPSSARSNFYQVTAKPPLPAESGAAFRLYTENPQTFFALCAQADISPISLKQLPKHIQKSVGAVHKKTLPVYKGLLKSGFQKSLRRHILDGGLFLEAERHSLPFVQKIRPAVFRKTTEKKGMQKQAYLYGGFSPDGGFSGGVSKAFLSEEGIFFSNDPPAAGEGAAIYAAPFS